MRVFGELLRFGRVAVVGLKGRYERTADIANSVLFESTGNWSVNLIHMQDGL